MARIGGAPCLCARRPAIVIPYEFGGFKGFGEQGIPDGCGRPREHDPRDAEWTTHPLAPFGNLLGVSVCHRPESFKPRAQMLQFAALAKAANEGRPVDGYDGFQHPCGHVGQLAKNLLRCREETLEFGDGGRSLLSLDPGRLIAAHGVSSKPGSFLLDCRRERANGERVAFCLGLDEERLFEVQRVAGKLYRMVESRVGLPGLLKVPP